MHYGGFMKDYAQRSVRSASRKEQRSESRSQMHEGFVPSCHALQMTIDRV